MKKIFKLMLILAFAFCCLAGCENADDKQVENAPAVPQPAEVADLQPGESVEIAITPELREYYFALGRLQGWCYLPEFAEGEPPTDPLAYWLLLQLDGIVGWDEHGWYEINSPWPYVDENTPEGMGTSGMPIVSVAEFDAWVAAHFANAGVEHGYYDYHKGYDYDGKNYYGVAEGSYISPFLELTELSAENVDGKIVYTATLYDNYIVDEYNYFYPDEELTPEQNRAALAEKAAGAESGERAVYDAYGEQLLSGEMSMDEAIRQTIISGNTQDFPHTTMLQVKYYLNGETQEPCYLAVHWQRNDN